MKIELLNRQHWISKIDAKLQWIAEYRAKQDKVFIASWRKRKYLPDRTGMPSHGEKYFDWQVGYMQYPCQDGWSTITTLKSLRTALTTENTGAIYVDDDELRMMEVYDAS